MVKVYIETENGSYAELIATFESEEAYNYCFPHLERFARSKGMILTESIDEN